MTTRLARSARRTHRCFLALHLGALQLGALQLGALSLRALPFAALLTVTSACEENARLFTDVRANLPTGGASPGGGSSSDAGLDLPDSEEPGAGGAGAAGGGAGSAGAPSAGGNSGSPGDDDDGEPPDEPDGDDEPGAGGSDPGGGNTGGADPGDEGGVYEPPPNDYSCSDVCIRRGGRCFEGTCHFDCDEPGSCSDEQTICPGGEPCEVRCGDDACAQNVVCSRYSQCNVLCEGERSCGRQVICEGVCDVTCSGRGSCPSGIGGAVELLAVDCSGERSCAATVSCEGQECRLECSGRDSCARIRTLAVQNTVTCSGAGSCADDVLCLGATCDVDCADGACENGVDCRALSCSL